jgi:hypothetical protein
MQSTYSPQMQTGTQANSMLANLLGLGNKEDGDAAFKNYRDSSGYDFMMNEGQRAITGSAAAKGLLSSGATAKGLTAYGQNLASTKFGEYLDKLMGVNKSGMEAGGLITQAGQTSKSSSSQKPGIGKFIGTILSGGAGG